MGDDERSGKKLEAENPTLGSFLEVGGNELV